MARKRTNKDVPAKGRLRDMADQLWSLAIRNDWANQCAVCGKRKCEAHHLVPRTHEALRFELRNGVALCAHCHKFDKDISPHQNAAGWMEWLLDHHAPRWRWYQENRKPPEFTGTKNAPYYCEQIQRLRQYVEPEDFVRIVGQRFSAWLEEQD